MPKGKGTVNDKKDFEKLVETWDEGENHSQRIDDLFSYFNGTNYKNPQDSFFVKETRTNCNIINQIVEAKHSATLDAQFTASVVPEIYSFSDIQSIKDLQAVADILDKGVKQVLAKNKADDIKERVLRWGFIKFGNSQVSWDVKQNKICIEALDPRNVRWNKGAKVKKNLTWIGYSLDIDVAVAKCNYARLPDGSFDVELCQKLDEASGEKTEPSKQGNNTIGNYTVNGDNPSAGLAYIQDSVHKGTGKNISIVVMFMFDGSMEAPEKKDSPEDTADKQDLQMKHPNGRMVTFVPDKSKQIMLEDKPAPEAFKSLGNIDFFNTTDFESLDNGNEVEMLVPIQERINGTYRKLRSTVGGNIDAVLFDDRHRGIVDDSALVNFPVQFIEGLGDFQPPVVHNGMIDQAMKLHELIESYKQEAYETARINRAWLSGANQDNVKSGDHADALNESAMSAIRSIQRNFKDYYINVCEKIVALIIENYSSEQLIDLAVGIDNKQFAQFDSQFDENNEEIKIIKIIDEKGQIVNQIKLDKSWQFRVDVTSGTEIPRSRRENADLTDIVIASPIMQSGNIDLIDMYLTAKDFPNRRAVVELLRKQQEEAKANPVPILEQLSKNPESMKAWADLFKALTGFSEAQGALLKKAGLSGTTDTITSAPAQTITAKSSADKIAIIAPQQISGDQTQAKFGHEQATGLEVLQHTGLKKEEPLSVI